MRFHTCFALAALFVVGCNGGDPASPPAVGPDLAVVPMLDSAILPDMAMTPVPDLAAGPDLLPPPMARRGPIGTNLTRVSDWTGVWPFVDAFKASRAWI